MDPKNQVLKQLKRPNVQQALSVLRGAMYVIREALHLLNYVICSLFFIPYPSGADPSPNEIWSGDLILGLCHIWKIMTIVLSEGVVA